MASDRKILAAGFAAESEPEDAVAFRDRIRNLAADESLPRTSGLRVKAARDFARFDRVSGRRSGIPTQAQRLNPAAGIPSASLDT
jgi:hypothetical protein